MNVRISVDTVKRKKTVKTLKKQAFMLLAACMVIGSMSLAAFADSSVDTQGRHVIYTEDDLKAVAHDLDGTYILAGDITLNGDWTPLGQTGEGYKEFTGTFDGNGYEIKGLSISSQKSEIGLFAVNSGTIEDLDISVESITGAADVGAVAGENSGTITGVHVLGGGTIEASSKSGEAPVGGLVGINNAGGQITGCSAKNQSVAGYNGTGGLAGRNDGTIFKCFTFPMVNIADRAGRTNAGGLAGINAGEITDCYVHKSSENNEVLGTSNVGGFVGENLSVGIISNSYVNIVYDADESSYGDIGANSGTVTNCFTSNTTRNLTTGSTFTQILDWPALQKELIDDGNWALKTSKPVQLQWELEGTYTLTFTSETHNNADFAEVGPISVTGGTATLPAAPANSGSWVYDFLGWSDGKGNTYKAGAEINVTEDMTLNAVWRLHSVDGDGDWDIDDAKAIMNMRKGELEFKPEQEEIADLLIDGEINYKDAMYIMDKLAEQNAESIPDIEPTKIS